MVDCGEPAIANVPKPLPCDSALPGLSIAWTTCVAVVGCGISFHKQNAPKSEQVDAPREASQRFPLRLQDR